MKENLKNCHKNQGMHLCLENFFWVYLEERTNYS
jgi:hypothetical protein